MQPPYRRPYDEDDDPDEQPRSPLDLRSGYRSRADADDRAPRSRDDDRASAGRSGLPVRPSGSAPDKKASDKDKGGRLGLPFGRGGKDSEKSSPPSRAPFSVRGDDLSDADSGGRRMPFSRGKDDKKQDKKQGDKKSGGRLGGLPFGKGKDDKQTDRPARPAFGGSPPGAPGRSTGGTSGADEKKGGLGGLLGRKGKDDKKPDDKGGARPGGTPPRRSPYDDIDDDRASRGLGTGSLRGDSPLRPPAGGIPGDRSAAQRSPLGGAAGPSDRDRGPFSSSPSRSPLGEGGGLPRRSPLSPSPFDDDDDDGGGPPARAAGLGASARPQDRSPLGGGLDRADRLGAGARPGAPSEQRPPQRSPLGGAPEKADSERSRGGLLGGLPTRRGEEKAPAQPGSKASRSSGRALPETKKAPRIVKHGLDLDRKLDLIGVSLVGFALVVFFAVLPSMSFGILPPVTGGLTGTINHFLSQLFGWGKIIWPLTSAVIGIWLMMRYFGGQLFDVDYFRVVGAFSLYGCALTWLHFFELANDPAPTVEAFREISRHVALELGEGGGWFGHQFYLLLLSQLGDWGAISVMIAWLVVGLMLTFDVSLVELGQFVTAMLAAFNFSPAERARKREAQATAEAAAVGVTRPGETGPARARQMPLAPSPAVAGADRGTTPALDASGARGLPVIRKPQSATDDATIPPGEPSPAQSGASAADEAPTGRGGLLARHLPNLRRPGAADTPEEKASEGAGSGLSTAAAAAAGALVAGTGLGGRMGRFLRRDAPADDETPAVEATKATLDAASAESPPTGAPAATGAPGAEVPSDGAESGDSPPRRMSGFTIPTRDSPGAIARVDTPSDVATQAPDDTPDDSLDDAPVSDIPRRPQRAGGLFGAVDETPASGTIVDPPRRMAADLAADADKAEGSAERALPFANPFRSRPTLAARDAADAAQLTDAPGDDSTDADASDEITPPVRNTGAPVRPGRDDTPPPRRSLPFGSNPAPHDAAPDEATDPADAPARTDEPPVRERSPLGRPDSADARPTGSAPVRSFLDGMKLPQRPSEDNGDANQQRADESSDHVDRPPQRGAGVGDLLAGAALAGAALAGASALTDRDDSPSKADDAETEMPPAVPTRSIPAPRRAEPVRPDRQRATAADLDSADDEDDEEDLDLLDEDEPDEEPLFETPARPAGLVRPPQRPGATQPQPSDAGVRAANEFTARVAREDTEQTRPSDDFTRRAPAPARNADQKPVSRTTTPNKRVEYSLPDIGKTLKAGAEQRVNDEVLLDKARVIEDTLGSFGAPGKVVEVNPGPVITQFGVEPDYQVSRSGKKTRVKVSSIARLDADLALALAAKSIRIEAPVPGKGFVGIEVPNDDLTLVTLRDVIESPEFKRVNTNSKLAIALGLGVDGSPVAADLSAMPHLLIAGTTGSGKSVCVNAIITCLLANNTPEDVQFIMVDPKRVELTGYNGIPHLVAPVVVDLERIVGVLQWVQREMEERYRRFADTTSRNILDYNRKANGQPKMPYLVVVIDELADLMMLAPDETERLLARLAQMARATGIHLIISTQRPSVDIITGLIKANFPARIAFAVASSVDSRVILDQPGAEKLLGRGDMLYQSPDAAAPLRMQGVYVSDDEISRIISHWRPQKADHSGASQLATVSRNATFNAAPMDGGRGGASLPTRGGDGQPTFWNAPGTVSFDSEDDDSDEDDLYRQAVEVVQNLGKASISLLQRRLRIGYTRAARLIDLMEQEGIVGPAESGSKPREVLKYD